MSSPVSSQPPASAAAPIVDLFGPAQPATIGQNGGTVPSSKPSDDLLQLGNPFADMFGPPQPAVLPQQQQNMWTNGNKILVYTYLSTRHLSISFF